MTLFPHHNALPRPASNEPPPTLDAVERLRAMLAQL